MSKMLHYIMANKLFSLFWGFMVVSLIFKAYFHLDFTIPCLFNYIWGVSCPGCGLTTACTALANLNFLEAYHQNPLVFVVVPGILYYFIKDFLAFSYSIKNQ